MELWLIIILAILVIFLILYLLISYVFSRIMVHSVRQPIVKTPNEYEMEYKDIELKSTDGLNLKGWFIKGTMGKIIVIPHPMFFNRHGFIAKNQGLMKLFKTDVDFLNTVKVLNEVGYSILMFDFRNHGESDKGITGVGLNEYQDILGVMNYIKSQSELNSQPVGFVSFCMGADSTIVAMSKAPEEFKNVKCFMAIQPVSAKVFVHCFVKKKYTPIGLMLIPLVNKFVKWQGGYAFKEMSPLKFAKDLQVPTLYIQAKTDPWTKLSDIESFYDATPSPKELLLLEEKMKRFDTYNYFAEHSEKMLEFLKKYL